MNESTAAIIFMVVLLGAGIIYYGKLQYVQGKKDAYEEFDKALNEMIENRKERS